MPDPQNPDENKQASSSYERPSERMFRRSRAAQAKRRQAQRKEDKFMRLVFAIAGFALLLSFLFFYALTTNASAADAPRGENSELTTAVLGNFSILDIGGIAFVIIAGYAVWRKYNGSK